MATNKASSLKNWVIVILIGVIILLLWKGKQIESYSFSQSAKLERLQGEIAVLEHFRANQKKIVDSLFSHKEKEADSLEKQLNEYKSLPVKEKIRIVKVFQPDATFNDSMICFTEEGIDSINKLALTFKSTLNQLNLSDSIIVVQQGIITTDSLQIGKEREISAVWQKEANKQKNKAKFWKSVGIFSGGVSAASLMIFVLNH